MPEDFIGKKQQLFLGWFITEERIRRYFIMFIHKGLLDKKGNMSLYGLIYVKEPFSTILLAMRGGPSTACPTYRPRTKK